MTATRVADGVYCIDTGAVDTGFLTGFLFDDAAPTLVDPGPPATAASVLESVADCGVDPSALEHLVLSHVHIDHAGAAGAIVGATGADVHVHGTTARHLVDPSALVESTREAMGEHFAAMGEPEPVPAEGVVAVTGDRTALDIGDATLELLHAPGHSPDHLAVYDRGRRFLYAAECLGGYLPRADLWAPPATLPNFEVETLAETIDRLRALDPPPERIGLAHAGVWPEAPEAAFETAAHELHRFDDRIRERYEETGSVEATTEAVAAELLDVSPPYDPAVEAFYARLIARGYLRDQGVDVE